ncbi:MAG: hypothetical protein RLZZ146_393, partial [Bacteroidota bacterium]
MRGHYPISHNLNLQTILTVF